MAKPTQPVLCGDCGGPIGMQFRTAHSACFLQHRDPSIIADNPVLCSIVERGERCAKPKVANDWCNMHNMRRNRYGDPLVDKTRAVSSTVAPCDYCDDTVDQAKRLSVGADQHGKRLCRKHYSRWQRHGDATVQGRRVIEYTGNIETDVWSLADTHGGDTASCWAWSGVVNKAGYGIFRQAPAHRVAYQLHHGPVDSRLVIDHTCHDPRTCDGGPDCPHRRCVNPTHLKAVTHAENVAPGRSSNSRYGAQPCGVPDCEREYIAKVGNRPLCSGHYQRFRKYGDTQDHIPIRSYAKRK